MIKLLRIVLPVILILGVIGGSLLIGQPVKAATDNHWLGGTGNWNDNAKWSLGHYPPDATESAIFDSGGTYSVTINIGASCYDFTVSDAGCTITGFSNLSVNNNLSFATGSHANTYFGNITMTATALGKTITTNSVVMGCNLILNGGGGGWTLQDNWTSIDKGITVTNGTFDSNAKTINANDTFGVGGSGVADITNSTIYCKKLDINAGCTLTTTGSTIYVTPTMGFADGLGGKTYNDVTYIITAAGTSSSITGANTFRNFSVTGINTYFAMPATTYTGNLTLVGGSTADASVNYTGTQTVAGTFLSTGYSATRRLIIKSDTLHTQRTISAATVGACSNTLFRDIIGAGAGSWDFSARTDIGNCYGNTGITFPTGVNCTASGIIGNSNFTAATWSPRVPLPQDTAIYNATSVTTPGVIITLDISNLPGITTTLVQNNPQFDGTTDYFYGSLNLGTCLWNVGTAMYMLGQTGLTLSGDFSFGTCDFYIDIQGGAINQSGALTVASANTIYLRSGIWITNGYAVTAGVFDSSTNTYNRALWMGTGDMTLSSTFTLTSTAATTKWNINATNMNVDCIQSVIVFTNTGVNTSGFTGGGKTYYGFQIRGSGSYTTQFNDANTFNYIYIVRSNDTVTAAAAKTISGNFTQTVSHLYSPLYGVTVTTISNVDFSKSSGLVSLDYLNFNSGANTCTAGGGATFLAGTHSLGSPQTGWSFTDAVAPTISSSVATYITHTTAVLNGSIDSLGSYGSEGVYIYFRYSLDAALTTYTETTPILYTSTGIKSATASPLTFNQTYYFIMICQYNGYDYALTSITSFVTLGSPTVTTQNPTSITDTGATLNGVLADVGDYTVGNIFLSFIYGVYDPLHPSTYTSTTPEYTLTAPGAFSQAVSGLVINKTYHVKAKARYTATAVVYGEEIFFTAGAAIGNPVSMDFGLYKVFYNVMETGDMLFAAEGKVMYGTNPTDYAASESYLFEVLNVAGTTPILSIPLANYGDRPIGIYCSASKVTSLGLSVGTAYVLRISGNPLIFSSAAGNTASHALNSSDYVDQLLGADGGVPTANKIRQEMITIATHMDMTDKPATSYMVSVNGYKYLGQTGGAYFMEGIQGLMTMCPILFQSGIKANNSSSTNTGTYASTLTIGGKWGATVSNGLTMLGGWLGISQPLAGSVVLFALVMMLAIFIYQKTESGVVVILMVAACPFIGAYLGLMPMALAFILVIIIVTLLGYFFVSRGAL